MSTSCAHALKVCVCVCGGGGGGGGGHDNRFYHNSFTYKLSHLWNQLPCYIKQSPNVSDSAQEVEFVKL